MGLALGGDVKHKNCHRPENLTGVLPIAKQTKGGEGQRMMF